MKKKPYLIFLLFLLLNLIPHIYVALSSTKGLLNWYITDDAFYYFKVAQNITQGRGISFDGIAPTNGFHPLWMLVCIPVFALARFDLYLPLRILVIVQAVLNAASGYFLYRLFADHYSEKAAWIVAFLWMFIASIHTISTKLGLESGLSIFCIIFFIYQISKYIAKEENKLNGPFDLLKISFAAILVLFSRLDNIYLLVFVGLWLVFRKSQMRWITQIDFILILFAAVLAYFSRIQTTNNIFNFLPFFYLLIGLSLVIKPTLLFFAHLYEMNGKITLLRFVIKTIIALTLASVVIGMIIFTLYDVLHLFRGYSRSVLILDWLLSIAFIVAYRLILFWKKHDLFGLEENNIKIRLTDWLKCAGVYFIPLFGMLLIYMILNKMYAGSAMPVSGEIKHWWGKLPNTVYGRPIKTLAAMIPSIFSTDAAVGPFWLITRPLRQISQWLGGILNLSQATGIGAFLGGFSWLMLSAAALAILTRRQRDFKILSRRFALLPFLTGCIFHVVFYKATGYMHTRYWYWLEEMILIMLFLGILLAVLFRELENPKFQWPARAVVVLVVIGIYCNFNYGILKDYPIGREVVDLYDYETDLRFLEENTDPGDVIGMTGGGVTSYLMPDRVFINLDGLINSAAYFESLKTDRTDEYLASIGLQYVYGEEEVLLGSDPYRWIFTDHLKLLSPTPSSFNFYQYCSTGCQ